jgi:hypothetical protein
MELKSMKSVINAEDRKERHKFKGK